MSSRGDVPLPHHIKEKGDSRERVNAYKHYRARACFQLITALHTWQIGATPLFSPHCVLLMS
jgi:hypothetical protein